jgi:hypothetical protein
LSARCRKRLDGHIRIAVALTLALLADVAPAQKADVLQIKVGDRWQFVLYYSVPSTAPNLACVVRSAEN